MNTQHPAGPVPQPNFAVPQNGAEGGEKMERKQDQVDFEQEQKAQKEMPPCPGGESGMAGRTETEPGAVAGDASASADAKQPKEGAATPAAPAENEATESPAPPVPGANPQQLAGGYAPPGPRPYVPYPPYGAPLAAPAQGQPPLALGQVYAAVGVVQPYTVPAKKQREAFSATRADGVMALYCVLLGFLFVRWVLPFAGWGVTAFTVLFCGGVLLYARAKRVTPPRASWFWLGIVLLIGACYAFWPVSEHLFIWQSLLLVGAALYWCASLFGVLLQNKTGNFLLLDAVNLVCMLPFKNLDTTVQSAKTLQRGKGEPVRFWRRAWPVLLGLCLCVPLAAIVLPMLLRADGGGFGGFLDGIARIFYRWEFWHWLRAELPMAAWQVVLGAPVAVYLCALLGGAAHKRYAKNIDTGKARQRLQAVARVPQATVLVVLAMLVVLYALFIGFQVPYFFAAFAGVKPGEYTQYSQYAREGFFELCTIAGINLGVVALAAGLCGTSFRNSWGLRVLNIALCAVTVLVMATAFSKMALYIAMHGLTPKRVMTCVFMVFLAGVCAAVSVLQFRQFSIVRFAAVYGAALLCALCLCNLDGVVVRYNAQRFKDGTLPAFDEVIVMRSGTVGAVEAYDILLHYRNWPGPGVDPDPETVKRLCYVLSSQGGQAQGTKGTARDCVANVRLRGIPLPHPKDEAEEQAWMDAYMRYHYPDMWAARYGG